MQAARPAPRVNSPHASLMVDSLGTDLEEAVPAEVSGLALIDPLPGPVISGFGIRREPASGRPQRHEGVDLGGEVGAPVVAAAGGRVTFVGDEEWGFLVVLDHGGGVETRYVPLDPPEVRIAQWVEQGGVLGRLGAPRRVTPACLHFEVRVRGGSIDPHHVLSRSS